ncbi:MAG: GTP-binding protein [Pseudoalteromonas tetraodonis]
MRIQSAKFELSALSLDTCPKSHLSEFAFALVYTKADKVKPSVVKKHKQMFIAAMSEWCEGDPEVFTTSSKSRDGRNELLQFVTEMIENP